MAVYSNQWYRVATLRPRLAPQVRLRRQRVRGDDWFVIADETSGRSVRLNHEAYAVAGRFDGRLTVQQVWDALQSHDGEPATQDDVVELLVRLREAALLDFDRPADFARLLPHLDSVAAKRSRFNPIAWRLPLGNPTPLLDRLRPLQRLLFSRASLLVWLAAIGWLVVVAAQHAPVLWAHALRWMATPRYALLAAALYVPIKLVHELAHGLAVRRWGGQVHEAGVTLMLLMPVPYVNASAASSFVRPRERIAVSAAGIMSELAIAAVALPLWLWLGDGLTRDAVFVTLVVTTVSTLLFNANPLQRLDGYYILVDALQLPNLAARSRAWWLDWLRRRLLHVPDAEPMPLAHGERPWLIAYAPLSWLYLLGVTAAAVLWLGQLSIALGIAAAIALAALLVLRPLVALIAELRRSARAYRGASARLRLAGAVALLAAVLLLAVPVPHHRLARGVVWPTDRAQLRAETAGFVAEMPHRDGDRVEAGELVVQLVNAQLHADHARQLARVTAVESQLFQAMPSDAAAAARTRGELDTAHAELAQLENKLAGLAVRAQVAGRLALPPASDLTALFVPRGQLIGQVLTGEPPTVRVALPEDEASDLRARMQGVSVRLADNRGIAWSARLVRDSVGATPTLPNAALSQRQGGDIQTDPQDAKDLQTLRPVVVLDVQLDRPVGTTPAADEHAALRPAVRTHPPVGAVASNAPRADAPLHPHSGAQPGERIGVRAWVRFDEGRAPLALQWAEAAQRAVMRRFNPQF